MSRKPKPPPFKIGENIIHSALKIEVENGKFVETREPRPVRFLAFSGNYAMVKRTDYPRVVPYVCTLKELQKTTP